MITEETNEHNGVKYKMFTSDKPVDASMTTGPTEKYVLNGKLQFKVMDGSYKYGKQIQIGVFNKSVSVKKQQRVPYAGTWDTVEIFVDRDKMKELCVRMMEELSFD